MAPQTAVTGKSVNEDNVFAPARAEFEAMLVAMSTPAALGLPHSMVETLVRQRGYETMRWVMQGHIDLRGDGEVANDEVEGRDGVVRTHKRLGERCLMTMFGAVVVTRLAFGGRGVSGLRPKDAELNLPTKVYSHGVQRLAAETAAKLSFDETVKALDRDTAAHIPKRQLEEVVAHAAVDFDAFYEARQEASRSEVKQTGSITVVTSDGKGIVVHPEDLREETRKAAEKAAAGKEERFDLGRNAPAIREDRKRMAMIAGTYTVAPYPRTAEDVVGELVGGLRTVKERPRPENKWLRASVIEDAGDAIEHAFQEGMRRDPQLTKRWVGLVDGNEPQIEHFNVMAETYRLSLTIILDFLHVAGYVWDAAFVFHPRKSSEAEEWARERLLNILRGKSSDVAAGMRRSATLQELSPEAREPVDACADYLLKYAPYLRYHEYLRDGLPIATGVIEGACRHLVQDRMDITGAVWRLKGAEAVLKLRALCSNGDFSEYWEFHEKQDHLRNHARHYANARTPPTIRPHPRRAAKLRVVT